MGASMLGIIGLLGIAIVGLIFLPFPKPEDDDLTEAAGDGAERTDWSDFDTGEMLALAAQGTAGATSPRPDADAADVPSREEPSLLLAADELAVDGPDIEAAEDDPLVIEDYAGEADALVLVYDAAGPRPEITWDAIAAGVRVFADGAQVALIKGRDSFDPAQLALIAE